MIHSIAKWFRAPAPADLARRQIEEHQRRLILARQNLQAATSSVRYHEGSISELRRTLIELEKS